MPKDPDVVEKGSMLFRRLVWTKKGIVKSPQHVRRHANRTFSCREVDSSEEGDSRGSDAVVSDHEEAVEDAEIASEPSSDDKGPAIERPYNSLLQILNANSEPSRARKRRKVDHGGSESKDRESEIQVSVDESVEQDVLENQEASEEEDDVDIDNASKSDDEDDTDGEFSLAFWYI